MKNLYKILASSIAIFAFCACSQEEMPVTVLSRCQRFDFHRIGHKDMVKVLTEYMENEKADVDISALEYIAERRCA